jgi:hypothetical protein
MCRGSGRNSQGLEGRSISRSIPTSTARSVRSSSQSIRISAKGPRLGVPPELADPVGALEVGEHQDVEQLGAGSRTESVQALPQLLLRAHPDAW